MSLRALVDSLLEQTAADISRQHHITSTALRQQVQESKTTKRQLEDHLAKVTLLYFLLLVQYPVTICLSCKTITEEKQLAVDCILMDALL